METTKVMNWLRWLIVALYLMGTSSVVHAGFGDILSKFQPYVTVQEEYSDNIDLTATNKREDFITTVYPGVRFSTLPSSTIRGEFRRAPTTAEEKYGFDLDYRLGLVFYAKETDNNYVSHEGTVNAWYTFNQRLTFRVGEYLIRSEEPREQEYPGAAAVQFISGTFVDIRGLYVLGTQRQRAIYLRNVFTPTIEYKFGREDLLSLNYRSNIYNNQSPLYEDSREDFINPKFTYWFNIRNGISLEYGLTLGHFERSSDLTGHMIAGRYSYRFNPRTTIFGEYEFRSQNFQAPSIDYNVQAPSLGIEHDFSPTLSGRVKLGYFWQSPRKGSKESGPVYDILLAKRQEKATYTLLFQGGSREDFFTAENLGFTKYHRAVGTVTYRLTERMTAGLSGSFERAESGLGRRDDIWGIDGNLSYQLFRWLSLSLTLSHREDRSNISNLDYSEYRGIFRVAATY